MSEPAILSCQELVELVTDYFERALSPAEQQRFEAHLALCDPCVEYIEQMRLTIQSLGYLGEEHIAPVARDRLLAAFRDWKHSPGFAR